VDTIRERAGLRSRSSFVLRSFWRKHPMASIKRGGTSTLSDARLPVVKSDGFKVDTVRSHY
jgi:hypothetical protein